MDIIEEIRKLPLKRIRTFDSHFHYIIDFDKLPVQPEPEPVPEPIPDPEELNNIIQEAESYEEALEEIKVNVAEKKAGLLKQKEELLAKLQALEGQA